MKAIFGRKMASLEELKEATAKAKNDGHTGKPYEVIKEIVLSDADFNKFANCLLEDQPWIEKADGGHNQNGEVKCIRVINLKTGERVLVNSEGYDYPRYTALEE
ncbi:DUF6329 domain-containing protein [Pelotomaculum propionicicum]|uniref:DUF6329 domain-containing protein n=1 Tax=Pelotomaculum propionicicum TaxID=258475 RepID=UPI003B7A2CF9